MHIEVPERWRLLQSGAGSAAFNMAMDEALLESAATRGCPVLRFYGWSEPAASFGYFQRYAEIERVTRLRPLVRRPTGGGWVPHDADWTYSLVVPPGHAWWQLRATESYAQIHSWVQDALAKLGLITELASIGSTARPGQCFAGAEPCDVLWHGRKIAGAAQRRSRSGLLIQGSVQPPPPARGARADWERAMSEIVVVRRHGQWTLGEPEPAVTARAEALARAKYSLASYNQRR